MTPRAATKRPARPVSEPTTTLDPELPDEVAAAADPEAEEDPVMEPEPDMDMEPDMEPVAEAADSEAPEAEADPEADLGSPSTCYLANERKWEG